jgi:transposase-like protein
LKGEAEFDEVYLVAGHKGHPDKVKAKGRAGRRRRLKGSRGRGTLEKEKPPILGMVERGGQVILKMLPNVQQATIEPVIADAVAPDTLIYTDEYNIYGRLVQWGYAHMYLANTNVTKRPTKMLPLMNKLEFGGR